MKKIVQRSYKNFIKKKIKNFKQRYSPANINIRERLRQAKEKAKAFAFRKDKKASKIEANEQKQLEEQKEKSIEEEYDLKDDIEEENEFVEDQNLRRELDEDGEIFKSLAYHQQAFARLYNEDPSQLFSLQEYKEVPNSGVIRITARRDNAVYFYQNYDKYEAIFPRKIVRTFIQEVRERHKRDNIDEDDGLFEKEDEMKRLKELEKEQEQEDQTEKVDIIIDNLKQSVKENVDKNVVIQQSKKAIEKVKGKMSNEVLDYMMENFPDFDLEIFEKEIEYIFNDIYLAYLNHNLNAIKDTCISEAYGYFQGLIEFETSKNGVHKMKNIFNLSKPVLEGSSMIQKQPLFVFSIKFQQIKGLVNAQNEEEYIEGFEEERQLMDFLIYVIPHPDPKIEVTGHPWAFIKVFERNKTNLLF